LHRQGANIWDNGTISVIHLVSLSAVTFATWLLLSGHYEPLIIWFGVGSTLFTVWVVHRMDTVDHEGHPLHLTWRYPLYLPWLIIEIIKANIDVARVILTPGKSAIQPNMMSIDATQKTELGHVIFANSITLTPGTVTVDLADGKLEVHALTHGARDGLATGDMDRRVTGLEGHE
jgi:multicomponent Na+:H+ antiporter subunit E